MLQGKTRNICLCENPENSFVSVRVDSSETKLVKYNRTLLFPLTRWIQMHRGEKITHKKLDEFRNLTFEVYGDWRQYHSNSDEFENDQMDGFHEMVDSVKWAMLHLWDVRGELRPWMANYMCEVLVGTRTTDRLPMGDVCADIREREYRGGPSSIEMTLGNISSQTMCGKNEFDSDEINEAKDNNQGRMDYEHNLEQYLNT